ncbi:MAG: hypothetical protein HRU34_00045 [Richelia sp.]|nr:hypothetical protein [Richelia sp.]
MTESRRPSSSSFVGFSFQTQQILEKILVYFPFTFIASLVVMKLFSQQTYWNMMGMEDGPPESAINIVIWIANYFRKYNQNKYVILYAVLALSFLPSPVTTGLNSWFHKG